MQQVYLPSCDRLDLLATHSSEVEEAIFFQTASLLDLAVDVVFYDATTVSFSIDTSDDIESSDALRQLVDTDGRRTGGDPRRVAGVQLGILG